MRLAARFLALRDRTSAQVRDYLQRKGALPDQSERIVARLSALGYLDDRAYAERWVTRLIADRPMGRERLKEELGARGVEPSLADSTIREALRSVDEDQLARSALDSAQRRGHGVTPMQAARLLRRRGFGEETIERMMDDRNGNEESVS